MSLRSRNGAILFKIEASEGVAENPSGATDAVLVENLAINFNPQNVQTNEFTGSLDNRGPIVGGIQMGMSFDVYLKGQGASGTAPEVGEMLRACGWSETVTAAAVPAAPEACAAGGSTTLAILGASASAVAQAYRGMPISITGAVTINSFISDYTAAKNATLTDTASGAIIATSNYQIPVNVRYAPASTTIPSGTLEAYIDGVMYQMKGCRGTFTLAITAAGAGKFSFTFTGIFSSKTDDAVPSCTYDATRPPIWKANICKINRVAAAVATLNFDNGNTLVYPSDPAATQGFGVGLITERAMTGSLDPEATLVATRNLLADMEAGTQRIVHATLGSTAGNRVGITMPAALITNDAPGDRQGIAIEQVAFSCIGQDAGSLLCFY